MIRVGLRCDASPSGGVGHVMRCLALAEALQADGAEVMLLGSVDVGWLRDQLPVPIVAGASTPSGLVDQALTLRLDAVVLDSYDLDPRCAGALRAAGVVSLAVVDGDTRGQVADVYLDQNLDADLAEPAPAAADGARPAGSVRLAGLRYTLIRRAVVDRRPPAARTAPDAASGAGPPRVLCFFGGTDAFGAAPAVTRLLVESGAPMVATVVVPDPTDAGPVRDVAAGQSITLVPPVADLPQLITAADLVVSAAGTSTWDLLCLGVPPALLWVVDNQRLGYARTVERGLAVGLGHLDDLRRAPAAAAGRLREVLTNPVARAGLAARGWAAVDGLGAGRVADRLAAVATDRRGSVRDQSADR